MVGAMDGQRTAGHMQSSVASRQIIAGKPMLQQQHASRLFSAGAAKATLAKTTVASVSKYIVGWCVS